MSEDNKDALTERGEWALEAAARDLGISVGEFKRRLTIEREIKRARALGQEWMVDAIKNCGTDFIQDIVRDNRAPTGPSSQGIIPSSQVVSNVRVGGGAGPPGGGTGWMKETPLGPPPGVAQADRLMDAQDRRDRAELIQREEAMKRK